LTERFEDVSARHGGERLVLLCFEDVLAGESCHRRTFAQWWEEQTGQEVPELDPDDFGTQQRLFE
jgi:rubrerythrin